MLIASRGGASLFRDLAPWLALLLVFVVVGFMVVIYLRRSLHSEVTGRGQGFTLQDLRDLHRSGKLSDDEFEAAKAAMIGRLRPTKPTGKAEKWPEKPGNGAESETPQE